MKPIFLFLLFAPFSMAQAQTLDTIWTFVNEQNQWLTQTCCPSFINPSGFSCSIYAYKFQNIVERDGKQYLQLFRSVGPDYTLFEPTNLLYREDSTGNVYLLNTSQARFRERLIYKFNVAVGDTITTGIEEEPDYKYKVLAIDSISLFSGDKRKRLQLTEINVGGIFSWIQGIGDIYAPLDNRDNFLTACTRQLACYQYNGFLEYETDACNLNDVEENYTPTFVNEKNQWHEAYCCLNSEGYSCVLGRFIFRDTVQRNSKIYKKLFKASPSNYNDFQFQNAFYREDSTGKVYRLQADSPTAQEELIYDFNLKINDTVQIGNNIFYYTLKAIAIDSVELNSGFRRKRLKMKVIAFVNNREHNVTEYGGEMYWIEGIGSELAPMNTLQMFLIAQCTIELACYQYNGTIEYETKECNLRTGTAAIENHFSIQIFPNPFTIEITIQTTDFANHTAQLFDAFGKLIMQQQITIPLFHFNTVQLPAGVYYLQLQDAVGNFQTKKIVKLY